MGNPSPKRRLCTGSLFGGSWAGGTSTLWGALPEYWSRATHEEMLHGNIDKACFALTGSMHAAAVVARWLLEARAYVVRIHITDRGISITRYLCGLCFFSCRVFIFCLSKALLEACRPFSEINFSCT
ncbi:hypothetical protein V8C42DRAFT_304305 [Trichoderma barbatum]